MAANLWNRTLGRDRRSRQSFVHQHADQVLAVDFFVVATVWLTQLYMLFFAEIGSRRIQLAGCTHHPSGAWVGGRCQLEPDGEYAAVRELDE